MTTNQQLTGAQAAIAQLAIEGVSHILTIPGEHNLPLCDAVLDHPQMHLLTARHEQGLAYMANGYARASHQIAVPMVISGPGVTNSLAGLGDAYQDSVPMVLIATQPPQNQRGKGAFHELKQQTEMLNAVVKWNTRISKVEDIPAAIQQAFVQAFSGRPGPATVEIPLDVQQQVASVYLCPQHTLSQLSTVTNPVEHAVQLLLQAQRPLLYVGRGAVISQCAAEIQALAERLNMPCFHTALAKGILLPDHPLNVSWGGGKYGLIKDLVANSDLVFVVGSSLDDSDAGRFNLHFPENVLQLDICADMIGRTYPVKCGLVGDAKLLLQQLLATLPTTTATSFASSFSQHRQMGKLEKGATLAGQYIDSIQTAINADTLVFSDPTWVNGWAVYFLERGQPNTFHCARNFCGLGFSFPAALGAKLAYPNRQVLALIGDGGFMFSNAELATAVAYQLNVVTIIFNDQGYGSIKRRQQKAYQRLVGVDLPAPDFMQLTQAFGALGLRADTPAALTTALHTAWQHQGPVIIEVPLDNNDPNLDI